MGTAQPLPAADRILLAAGVLLMALPGLFTDRMRWAFVVFQLAGCLLLVRAVIRSGASRPRTALVFLLGTNLSFWLGYALWRLRVMVAPPGAGIDSFAGPVALWVLLFAAFLIYEGIAFVRALFRSQERRTAVIGLAATAAQVVVTMRTAFGLIEGV